MQCVNCQFFNIPGSASCARCASPLDLTAIAFEPPRRSGAIPAAAIRFGILTRLSLRSSFVGLRALGRDAMPHDVSWPAVIRSAIPGWGHRYLGHHVVGNLLTGLWLPLLLGAIIFMGDAVGIVLAVMTLGVHSTAVSLIFAGPLRGTSIIKRMAISLLSYAVIILCIYRPLEWFIHGIVRPIEVRHLSTQPRLLLQDGDIVLVRGRWRQTAITRGDVVAVEFHEFRAPGLIVRPGSFIDRVLAVGGDEVRCQGSILSVNGTPLTPAEFPIAGVPNLPDFVRRIPEGHVFVIPSLLNAGAHGHYIGRHILEPVFSMPAPDRVLGVAELRWRPFKNMGGLRASAIAEGTNP